MLIILIRNQLCKKERMKINSIEDKKRIEMEDREFLMEFDQLLGVKSQAQDRFDKLYKDEIKSEPAVQIFRNLFLPFAFLILDEAHKLIIEKLAEEKIQEKVL